jgi:hypothetical protein
MDLLREREVEYVIVFYDLLGEDAERVRRGLAELEDSLPEATTFENAAVYRVTGEAR